MLGLSEVLKDARESGAAPKSGLGGHARTQSCVTGLPSYGGRWRIAFREFFHPLTCDEELSDHWEVGWVKRLPHGCLLVSLQVKKQPRLHMANRIHLWRPDEAPSKLSLENLRLVLHQAAPPLPEVPVRPLARRIPYLNHYSLVNRKQTPGGRYVTPEK